MSDFMARKAKQLIKEKGVLSTPNPIPELVVVSLCNFPYITFALTITTFP